MRAISALLPLILAVTCLASQPLARNITVYTGTWIIDFEPSGRAHAQYGSLPGDGAYVEEGTINFENLLETIKHAPREDKKHTGAQLQVAIHYEGDTSATFFSLRDPSFLETLLHKLESRCKQDPLGNRFEDLRRVHPIVE